MTVSKFRRCRCRDICYAETGAIRELSVQQPSRVAVLIAGLMLAASGCAGSATRPAPPSTDAVAQPAVIALTIQNILQGPLEGQEGFMRAVAHLRDATLYGLVAPLQSVSLAPFRTVDGYRVETVWFKDWTQSVSIGLDDSPCLEARVAVAAIGANPEDVHQGSHGEDVGAKYTAVRNGVTVRLSTANTTSACVQNIYIDLSARRNVLKSKSHLEMYPEFGAMPTVLQAWVTSSDTAAALFDSFFAEGVSLQPTRRSG